jgi:hypothetical protein
VIWRAWGKNMHQKRKAPQDMRGCFRVDTEIPGLCCLFRLDQQLAFDPYLTCTPSFLLSQTARRDQFDSGSGLTTNRANQTTPRDSNFAFDVSCSPQPAARYRPSSPLSNRLVWMSPSVSGQLAPPGCVENCRLQHLTETRVSISLRRLRSPQRPQELPFLRRRAAALDFNRTAVLLNANTCGIGCRPSASHACVAYSGGRHWRLPPRPELR